ncbi:hypothetical protein QBC34DRAFT_450803 [Podospora aff. communis PSN243]|uniref:Uncharacterized protein n=1 Tax=Podospora aff. communis PSN243 TaxID=3040156 RepID=A0AAV9GD08_9PEZI|nr:hypothetical protein QBC34DRAFT_450803 [Podospora aff. communis PSN243]
MADSLCLTPACMQAASNLVWQLAPNWDRMDPCTDFDKMVCHHFKDSHVANMGRLELMGYRNLRIVSNILEGNYSEAIDYQATPWKSTWTSNAVDEANFRMLQRSYEACLDTEAIAALGTKPLVDLVANFNTIWPLTDNLKAKMTDADRDGLSKASVFLHELGISGFMKALTATSIYDAKTQWVVLTSPEPVYKNLSMYSDPAAMKEYAEDIAKVFLTPNYPRDISAQEAASLGEGIAKLEVDIVSALGTADASSLRNVTLEELGAIATPLGLDKILKALLPSDYPENKIMGLAPASYFANLTSILSSHPKAVIQGYFIHKTLDSFAEGQHIITRGSKPTPIEDREQFCVNHLDDLFRFIVTRFFSSATYPDAAREFASKLTTDLREEFKERIGTLDWMSSEAKERARKKVDNMVQNIGYPTANPDVRSPESLAAYYKTVNVTDNFFANVVSARRFTARAPFADVLNPPNRGDFGRNLVMPNANYQAAKNSINIFVGVSQLPVFSELLPGYASYGSLGSIIGHEILHGFDNTGSQYNEDAEPVQWWDNTTIAAYEERLQCFVDQYSNYTYPIPGGTKNTDGQLTLGENLSDAGGLRVAYSAWKKTQTGGKKDLNLPGLEKFSHDQLFFLFYANTWCNSFTTEFNLKTFPTDEHAHHSHRIVGGTANSRAFREAFQCKVKEPQCELF